MSPGRYLNCALTLISLGTIALTMGIVFIAIEEIRFPGIIFLSVGGGFMLLGIPTCRHSIQAMNKEKRETVAQQTSSPVVCGLIPGEPVAGNYLEQTQPLQESEHARNPGYSTQSGSHRPQSGYSTQSASYHPQSGSGNPQFGSYTHPYERDFPPGSYHQLHERDPPARSYYQRPEQGDQQLQHSPRSQRAVNPSGGLPPPSYSEIMYGPAAKFATTE